MPTIVPNRYPLDYSGTLASNLIENEVVQLQPGPFRVFSPLYSPYFQKNIVIVDSATGLTLQPTQYSCRSLVGSVSAISGMGNDVYSIVVILDEAVSNSLTVDYQSVGGHYTTGYESLLGMIDNLLNTNQGSGDPMAWSALSNLPEGFTENLHLHTVGATTGWEYLAAALEKLKNAILMGDQLSKQFVLSYIDQAVQASIAMRTAATLAGTPFGDHILDQNNPHNITKQQLSLDLVENYATATLAQAYEGTAPNLYVTADQVRAVVLDQINLGMDAHIANQANPHAVTKTQVGLSNIMNYPVASASDLTTPVTNTPKYVTNIAAAAWLSSYFTALNSGNASAISTMNANSLAALTAAQDALAEATAASTAVAASTTSIAASTVVASNALTTANQNTVDAQNAESAAQQLIQDYLAPALVATESAAYARGFADGVASQA